MTEKKKPTGSKKASSKSRTSKMPREAFHMPEALHKAFLAYLAETKPEPDKSETLRHALTEFLKTKGFWPPPTPSPQE